MKQTEAVVGWCGRHKIKYVFCADSNFGIFKRDLKIAHYLTEAKCEFGFPEKFRACCAKNAEDTVHEIGKLLHRYEMQKGVTLSRQTYDRLAAYNVRRENIDVKIYQNLQKKYEKENISVYAELILGFPGETYESFRDGIEQVLETGIKTQVFVYFCQVYPNTELADLDYQKKYRISTTKIPLSEIHGVVRSSSGINEYEEIIISTMSMDINNWKKSSVLSWLAQVLHGLKLGFYILIYLKKQHQVKYTDFFEYIMSLKTDSKTGSLLKNEMVNFYNVLDSILQGNPRGQIMPDFGNIYWDVEEASYLRIIFQKNKLYKEMLTVIIDFLEKKSIKYKKNEVENVIEYQKAVIPHYNPMRKKRHSFSYNIPEYFDKFSSDKQVPIIKKRQVMILTDNKNNEGNKKTFAKEIVVYGRKSNKMVNQTKWFDCSK